MQQRILGAHSLTPWPLDSVHTDPHTNTSAPTLYTQLDTVIDHCMDVGQWVLHH